MPRLAKPYLLSLGLLLLALATGCEPKVSSKPNPVTITGRTGNLYITGPFSRPDDQLIIHGITLYEEDIEQIIAGHSSMIGSTHVEWNDKTVFALNDSDSDVDFLEDNEEITTYDYVYFHGYCLRESNGMMSLIFGGNYSGTVNASRPEDLFYVYYDEKAKAVKHKEITEDFATTQGCVDKIDAYEELISNAAAAEKQLIASLSPSDDKEPPLTATKLKEDPIQAINAHFKKYQAYYESAQCGDSADSLERPQACLSSLSQFSLIAKHPEYEIHRLEFIHDCNSRGVELLYLPAINSWYHLYSIPSGCSKHFLYHPEYSVLAEDQISLKLCNYCTHWGNWEDFVFNLSDFKIRKVKQ